MLDVVRFYVLDENLDQPRDDRRRDEEDGRGHWRRHRSRGAVAEVGGAVAGGGGRCHLAAGLALLGVVDRLPAAPGGRCK